MSESTPGQLYIEGKLNEAVEAANSEVKQHPSDTDRRWLLCELLCFVDDLERADRQLETIGKQDPKSLFSVTMFRNLIRAENARRRFYTDGQPPEVVGGLTDPMRLHLDAAGAIREGRLADALQALSAAEERRPRTGGVCDDEDFDDLRDTDDLTSSFLEALTPMGDYCWIPWVQIESILMAKPARMTDVVWRSAEVVKKDGSAGQVYLPALYYGTAHSADDLLRLGRRTDWWGGDGEPTRGIGQRLLLVGDQGRPLLEINSLHFRPVVP
jgi:type VI secretion system protein ImpE